METESKTYYEVLEVPSTATQEEIIRGYQKVKNAYSGDSLALYSLLSEAECREILSLIEEAYSILSVPEKRAQYDRAKGLNQSEQISQNHPDFQFDTKTSERLPRSVEPAVQINDMLADTFKQANMRQVATSIEPAAPVTETISSAGNTYNDRPEDFNINRKDTNVPKVTAQTRFSLDYLQDPKMEEEIENTVVFSGEFLRKVREYKNVTIERMSDVTKISKTYLKHIESNNWEKLPAQVYTRGFVYQYAKFLKLTPEIVANSYLQNLNQLKNDGAAN